MWARVECSRAARAVSVFQGHVSPYVIGELRRPRPIGGEPGPDGFIAPKPAGDRRVIYNIQDLGDAYVHETLQACLSTTTSRRSHTMALLEVKVKHAGKVHDVQLDTGAPPAAFKDAIYQKTGVPPERMKVMIKGGMLKVCCMTAYMARSY